MDTRELMTLFQRFEKEHSLFDQLSDNAPWWDSVRYDVYLFLEGIFLGRPPPQSNPPMWRRTITSVRGAISRRNLYAKLSQEKGGALCLRAPRNREGSKTIDRVIDPIAALFQGEIREIDTFPRRYHVPIVQASSRSGSIPATVGETLSVLSATFDISQDQVDLLKRAIRFRRHVYEVELSAYRRLLDLAQPKLLVLVQNGIEKSLFCAAKERGIPTVEAQHGLIGFSHPAYSYSPDISYNKQKTFPDLFLTFSEHWATVCHFPADAIVSVGNDSFNPASVATKAMGATMFVSSFIHHAEMVPWVSEVAMALPDRRIFYKLHPNQAADATRIVKDFRNLPNIEVISGQTAASTLMKEVSHVVAVCSTVVYEALQAGRKVLLLPESNHRCHLDVFNLKQVDVPSSPAELICALTKPCIFNEPLQFFDRFDPDKARTAINGLRS